MVERSAAARFIFAVGCFVLLTAGAPGLVAQVIISEVLTSNRSGLRDADGDTSDWFEVYNGGQNLVRLEGWSLTDNSDDLTKWPLGDIELAAGSYLIVFASGKDRREPGSELHTNFRTSSQGEFLALVSPDGTPQSFFAPTYPEQRPDISYGVPMEATTKAFLPAGTPARILVTVVRSDLPSNWNDPDLDDSGWQEATLGLGYDLKNSPTFSEHIQTDVGDLMFEKNASVFVRVPFDVPAPETLGPMRLVVRYDGGFIAFLNGVELARRNATSDRANARAASARTVDEALMPETVALQIPVGLLRAGTNVFAFQAQNQAPASSDFLFAPVVETTKVTSVGSSRFYFVRPTPGLPNAASGATLPPERIVPEIQPAPGEYSAAVEVTMGGAFPISEAEIRYTLNGAPPDEESPVYEGPFSLQENTVVRAAVFPSSELTDVVTHSYFIDAERYDLPIISIAMAPNDFRTVQLENQARGIGSEWEGNIEFFEADGALGAANGMGLRLHGARGRNGDFATKKSYRTYYRGIYGEPDLLYQVIPDTPVDVFDKLVLRGNVNDRFTDGGGGSLLRDQLGRDLHGDMGEPIAHGTWYNLFVNMEYRGVYNVVERIEARFLGSYLEEQEWYVIRTNFEVAAGDPDLAAEALRQSTAFFLNNDLADENVYAEARTLVDVEALARHIMHNVWIGNGDWPHNNWYVARPATPGGRWFFISWDTEFGFSDPRGDTFEGLRIGQRSPIGSLFTGALKNAGFQRFFLEEFERQIRSALSEENVLARLDRLREIVSPDIPEEGAAVGADPSLWPARVDRMADFIPRRTPFIREAIYSSIVFDIPRIFRVEPETLRPGVEADVTLHGFDFTADTVVTFNGVDARRVVFVDENVIRAVLPSDAGGEGAVEIFVENPSVGGMATDHLLVLDPNAEEVLPEGQLPGDCNQDRKINIADPICLVGYLFGGGPVAMPCGDGSGTDAGNVSLADSNGSGAIDLSDVVRLLNWSFFGGPEHVLGSACAVIPGCTGVCVP
jgi:hypothetical protein